MAMIHRAAGRTGQVKGQIYKSVDAMGRLVHEGRRPLSRFQPSENSFGKNPCELPVTLVPLSNKVFMTELLDTIKTKLNASSEEAKKAEDQMDDWSIVLGKCDTVDDLNALLPEIKKASKPVQFLLGKRARALGFVANKKTGLYELAKEAAHA